MEQCNPSLYKSVTMAELRVRHEYRSGIGKRFFPERAHLAAHRPQRRVAQWLLFGLGAQAIKRRRRIMRTRLSFDPLSMTERGASLRSRGDRRAANGRIRSVIRHGPRTSSSCLFLAAAATALSPHPRIIRSRHYSAFTFVCGIMARCRFVR